MILKKKKQPTKIIPVIIVIALILVLIFAYWRYTVTPDLSRVLDQWYEHNGNFKNYNSGDVIVAKDNIEAISIVTDEDYPGLKGSWTMIVFPGKEMNWTFYIKGNHKEDFKAGNSIVVNLHVIRESLSKECKSECWMYGPYGNETLKEFRPITSCGDGLPHHYILNIDSFSFY